MREDHAKRVQESISEHARSFDAAVNSGDLVAVKKEWLALLRINGQVMSDAIAARLEADSLGVELRVYRPTRSDFPAAPILDGYVYVHTAKFPWVCAAVEIVERVSIPGLAGVIGYSQEHSTPERKTICGKATTFPVSERFGWGGWPLQKELCPDCTKLLFAKPRQRELFAAVGT